MKIIIQDNERGLLKRDGRVVKWLEPGSHYVLNGFGRDISCERLDLDQGWAALTPEVEKVMPANAGRKLIVPADAIAALTLDGRPWTVLRPGKYVLWQERAQVNAVLYGTDSLMCDLPEKYWGNVNPAIAMPVSVRPYQRALVYDGGKLDRVLEGGRYLLSKVDREVTVLYIDLREEELQILKQELMTHDKVSVRVNLIVRYRVVDPVRAHEAVIDLETALYSEAQMAARSFVASMKVEEMLERRNDAVDVMTDAVRPRAERWGVEVIRVDLKDVVLPGEMKTILNQVIEAEKRAEANVILRREETAATRSLANTAKMLEKNPTLMRLKELEALKEVVGQIDHVTVVAGGGDGLGLMKLVE